MHLQAELFAVIDALPSAGVEYAICGGLAVEIHGHPRETGGIDLLIQEPDLARARRAVAALGWAIDSGLSCLAPGEASERRLWTVHKAVAGGLLSLQLLLVGDFLAPVWRDRQRRALGPRTVSVVSHQGLVQMKRAAARQRDLDDLARLPAPADGHPGEDAAPAPARPASAAAGWSARLLTPALLARCEVLMAQSPELRVLSQLLDADSRAT